MPPRDLTHGEPTCNNWPFLLHCKILSLRYHYPIY